MDSTSARMPILGPLAAAGFLSGILIAFHLAGPLPGTWAACIALSGCLLWVLPGRWGVVGALLCGVGLAALHVGAVRAAWLPATLEGERLQVRGRVLDLPVHEEGRRSFLFEVDRDVDTPALRGRVVRLGWYGRPGARLPMVRAGSRWMLTVKLKRPHGLRNPGALDTERSAFANRVAATGSIVGSGLNTRLHEGVGVAAVRDDLGLAVAAIQRPAARFIRALAVGDTRAIEERDWRVLRACGLTHLIAISGSHVAMAALLGVVLAWALWRVCPALGLWMPRRVAQTAAGALLGIGYTVLAGGEVPTVRTVLMMSSVAGAILLRRRLGVAHSLSAAAIAIALIDPLNVLRPGFWLSFAGVAWLAWCLGRVRQGSIRALLSSQGVATIGLLPLCILFFGQTSVVAPLANLIAVPFWGMVIVPLSILGVAIAPLAPSAAAVLFGSAAWLFDLAWPIFERMAQWPGAQLDIAEATPWAVGLAVLGALWGLMPRGMPMRWVSLALWTPLLAPAVPRVAHGELGVTFIDVGQGLSILVQTRAHTLLYDAGPKTRTGSGEAARDRPGFDAGEKVVLPALAALGVRKIDGLMLSHGDADHAGGAEAVVHAFHLKDVRAPHGTPVTHATECQRGDHWSWDGVEFEVLAPVPHTAYAGNASSCVLKISSAHGRVLLTGDIEAAGEQTLLADGRRALHADVVSMPHHGSKTSSTRAFVSAVGARYAIASSGYRNMFRHPRAEVWQRWADSGAQPVNTPASGAVHFSFSARGIEMTEERSRRRRAWDSMEGNWVDGGSGLSYGLRGSSIPQ